MKINLSFWCLSLFFLLAVSNVYGQLGEKHFRNISVDKGLSQSTVFSIAQDTLGFIWMGTKDGLNRYDGSRFTVYRPISAQPKSIVSSYISFIYVDKTGSLWIGGNRGISKYSYDTNDFENYQLARTAGEWNISSIVEDDKGNLWASSTGGDIFLYVKASRKFVPLNIDLKSYGIKHISFISYWKNSLVIGTELGLYQLSKEKSKLHKIDLGIAKAAVNCAYVDGDLLFVGTEGNGLITLHANKELINVDRHSSSLNTLADNNIRSISKDQLGNIWVGTFRGLYIYDKKQKYSTIITTNFRSHLRLAKIRCVVFLRTDKTECGWVLIMAASIIIIKTTLNSTC